MKNCKHELSEFSINENGDIEVSTPLGVAILVGFATSIFGEGFIFELKK